MYDAVVNASFDAAFGDAAHFGVVAAVVDVAVVVVVVSCDLDKENSFYSQGPGLHHRDQRLSVSDALRQLLHSNAASAGRGRPHLRHQP